MTAPLLNKRFVNILPLCALIILCAAPHGANASATIDHETIELQSLNKATAKTNTFEMKIGETIKLGPLYVRPRACRTTPPTEKPESAGFVQIWAAKETNAAKADDIESEWVFSGWMFASSPGISSLDHPVYDLWVLGCGTTNIAADETLLLIKEDGTPQNEDEGGADASEPTTLQEEDTAEDEAPVVIIDGEVLSFPSASEEEDPRFQSYDEEESAPILFLE